MKIHGRIAESILRKLAANGEIPAVITPHNIETLDFTPDEVQYLTALVNVYQSDPTTGDK